MNPLSITSTEAPTNISDDVAGACFQTKDVTTPIFTDSIFGRPLSTHVIFGRPLSTQVMSNPRIATNGKSIYFILFLEGEKA